MIAYIIAFNGEFNMKTQSGRSLLEMLAVIAIMGLISAAGLFGYNEVIIRNRALEIGNDALLRATATNSLSNNYFARRLAVNDSISLTGFSDQIQNIAVTNKKLSNTSFIISYNNVPKRICERVIETNAIGLYQTLINNNALSLENAASICNLDSNTVSFYFYRSGYASSQVKEAEGGSNTSTYDPCTEIRCSGCQVCLNGTCVNDDTKCSGCQSCNGICIDDNTKCSNGTCLNGKCYCQEGFGGDNCSEITVNCHYGYYNVAEKKCICNNGYTGEFCDIVDTCYGIDCSGHGTCLEGVCTCNAGYLGTNCETIDTCYGIDCSGNGTCSDGVCTCDSNYYSDDCSVYCNENQIYVDGECTCATIANCSAYNDDCTCQVCNPSYIPSSDRKSCILTPSCNIYPEGTPCYVSPSIFGVCHYGACLDLVGAPEVNGPVSNCASYSDNTLCYLSDQIISVCKNEKCLSIDEVSDPSTGGTPHQPGTSTQ